jgi:two-component sensor histidine kinase
VPSRTQVGAYEHLNEEINHRARNNLAMVSGLLQMQALQERDPGLAARLREAVARIRTFVDIHERIYATGAE